MYPSSADLTSLRRSLIRKPDDPFYHLALARERLGLPWDGGPWSGSQADDSELVYGIGATAARPDMSAPRRREARAWSIFLRRTGRA